MIGTNNQFIDRNIWFLKNLKVMYKFYFIKSLLSVNNSFMLFF